MNNRIDRVNSEMMKTISELLSEIKDPRLSVMVSVVRVDTATDLKTAKVYLSFYGDDAACKESFEAIKQSGGYLRRRLSKILTMRTVPELKFISDDSIEYSAEINGILSGLNIKKED